MRGRRTICSGPAAPLCPRQSLACSRISLKSTSPKEVGAGKTVIKTGCRIENDQRLTRGRKQIRAYYFFRLERETVP